MLQIIRYTPEHHDEWNLFVAASRNGTFLFDRRYMDYHADRFKDHSLMFYLKGKLYALLPANESEGTLYTHQGLTYGGLVMGMEATTSHVLELFEGLREYLKQHDIRRVVYKAIPWIYHRIPAEEPLYAIHRTFSYRIMERDVSSTIVTGHQLGWKKDRRHGLKLAQQNGVAVAQGNDYPAFWDILNENLWTNHGVKPVHTLDEIRLLHDRFPRHIVLFEARREGSLLGGCVVYLTPQVVHTQYIAATPEGKRLGVVDAIIHELLSAYSAYPYFDFGKSTEIHSDMLNHNLIYQKEGFGARAVCYDTYELLINN